MENPSTFIGGPFGNRRNALHRAQRWAALSSLDDDDPQGDIDRSSFGGELFGSVKGAISEGVGNLVTGGMSRLFGGRKQPISNGIWGKTGSIGVNTWKTGFGVD